MPCASVTQSSPPRLLSEVWKQASLNYGELTVGGGTGCEVVTGPPGPAVGAVHGLLMLLAAGGIIGEIIQHHLNIGIQDILDIHHVLR